MPKLKHKETLSDKTKIIHYQQSYTSRNIKGSSTPKKYDTRQKHGSTQKVEISGNGWDDDIIKAFVFLFLIALKDNWFCSAKIARFLGL